jgi:hypothetical protein
MTWLLAIQAAATLTMAAITLFVQVVQYPLFAEVGPERYTAYQRGHMWRITAIVFPTMLIEAACAGILVAFRPDAIPVWMVALGLALVIVVWLSTALLQGPAHRELEQGFDPAVHRRLLRTNWIRVVAWSVRAVLVLWMFALAG